MIIEKFEEAVSTYSNHIAVKTETQSLTYGELNQYADRIALSIREHTQPSAKNPQVALLFEHGIDMIAAVAGALKANRTYIPLDRSYPENRLLYMLENAGAGIILTNHKNLTLAQHLEDKSRHPLHIIDIDAVDRNQPAPFISRTASPEAPAYILYTSGSTGQPKGVLQTHGAVLYYTRNWVQRFNITSASRMTLLTAFSHDGFVQDLWSALLSGATLYPYDVKNIWERTGLKDFLLKESITIWHSVPTLYRYLAEGLTPGDFFPRLQYILLGGEPLRKHDIEILKTHFSTSTLANVYGQTESSVSSISLYTAKDTYHTPLLGTPLDETEILLVNDDGEIVEDLGSGEIVISCPYIARGYWKDEEKTGDRFTEDPDLGKLYWTGDQGAFIGDDRIELLGRKDFQIKIRGFRIELGEIESTLMQKEDVTETAVTTRQDPDDNEQHYICCYFTSPRRPLSTEPLREYLLHRLPDYMLPKHFVQLEKIPQTPTGKIDRAALPEPMEIPEGPHGRTPETETEKELARLWLEILRHEPAATDNFFNLGGQSLKAINLIARIYKAFHVRLELEEVFLHAVLEDMARCIDGKEKKAFQRILPVEEKEYYPLSPPQARMFILQQMDPQSIAYHLPSMLTLEGEIETQRLEESFRAIIERHDAFRTAFRVLEGEPVQQVLPGGDIEFSCQDLTPAETPPEVTGTPGGEAFYDFYSRLIKEKFFRPFDLTRPPLMRVGLVRLEPARHILAVDLHHIVTDGTSTALLVDDFIHHYRGTEPAPLTCRFRDYVQWLHRPAGQQMLDRQEEFWLGHFSPGPEPMDLPYDFPRPPVLDFSGGRVDFELEEQHTRALKLLAADRESTLFIVLLGLFNILLSRLSGAEDIVVGSPVAGRRHTDLQRVIGMFVNTLALRNHPHHSLGPADFLHQVKSRTLEAFANQEYPFEELVDKLRLPRDTGRNPLFDVMFALQNMDEPREVLSGPVVKPFNLDRGVSIFDLNLRCIEGPDKLIFSLDYASSLYTEDTVRRFTTYFRNILTAAARMSGGDGGAGLTIGDIAIITGEELDFIQELNRTGAEFPADTVIHDCFSRQVEQSPGRVALTGGIQAPGAGEAAQEPSAITYRELDRQASALAHELLQKGVTPGAIVALMAERSVEMLVALFGIIKAGGIYLPIEPGYPAERIRYMLADAAVSTLVTTAKHVPGLPEDLDGQVNVITPAPFPPGQKTETSLPAVQPQDGIYLIYTSGTTGRPKGVLVEHRSLVNRLHWGQRRYPLDETDVVLQKTTFVFDVSAWELFWWSYSGATLSLLPPGGEKSPEVIVNTILTHRVTTIHFVPSMLAVFLDYLDGGEPTVIEQLGILRRCFSSGEALAVRQVDRFNRLLNRPHNTRLFNLYGPTEATVEVTYYDCPEASVNLPRNIPIGKPIDNTQLYILDKNLHIQPPGIPGELHIAGTPLARGYLNRPELTARRFVRLEGRGETPLPSPLYKTGDLCRWLPDGNIEFLGRIDLQVKIRGFRIELGEIENRLTEHPRVKEAVTAVRAGGGGDPYLCAYLVLDGGAGVGETSPDGPADSQWREHLAQTLPEYMVPAYFVQLEAIPLTAGGKADRRRLPEPGISAAPQAVETPQNDTEQKLLELWAEVLQVEPGNISVTGNFFQAGGHSLRGTVLSTRIHREFQVRMPLLQLFKTPTIRGMAHFIDGAAPAPGDSYQPIGTAEDKEFYPLSPPQARLFILQQMEPHGIAYHIPTVLILEGRIDLPRMRETFRAVIERHDAFRTAFVLQGEQPLQQVRAPGEIQFDIQDLTPGEVPPEASDCESPEDEAFLGFYSRLIKKRFFRPFDLSVPPLLRAGVIRLETSRYILAVEMHHIVADGASTTLLVDDFIRIYGGNQPQPVTCRFRDYVQWLHRPEGRAQTERQKEYWLEQFQTGPVPMELPYDFPRPPVQNFAGGRVSFGLDEQCTAHLNTLAANRESTLFIILLSLVNVLLTKLSAMDDVVVGSPVAGRRHPDLQTVIGMFVNTLALRNRPEPALTLNAFFRRVKTRTLEAFENQEYPFENLVDLLQVPRDTGRNPLFDVMFALQNIEGSREELSGPTVKPFNMQRGVSIFDLNFQCFETGGQLAFTLDYAAGLFKEDTVRRFAAYFKNIVTSAAGLSGDMTAGQDPGEILIGDIAVITPEELDLIHEFNRTEAPFPADTVIHQCFARQADRHPDLVAVTGGIQTQSPGTGETFEEPSVLTYRELDAQARALAAELRRKGVLPGTIVAVLAERSLEMPVALFGILKAGGAYLPIEPGYPAARIRYMLADAAVNILLTTPRCVQPPSSESIPFAQEHVSEHLANLPGNVEVITLTPFHSGGETGTSAGAAETETGPRDGAYLIYTSGTTGRPKGVLVEHRSLMNRINWMQRRYPIGPSDVILQKTTYVFDVSLWELFWWSFYGASVNLLPPGGEKNPESIIAAILAHRVTTMHFVPSMLAVFLDYISGNGLAAVEYLTSLDRVFSSGEALPEHQVRKFNRLLNRPNKTQLINLYGPTEATVDVTYYDCPDASVDLPRIIPIGKPIDNTQLYILDKNSHLQPPGIPGELHIAGTGLARGYLNRVELTAQRFVRLEGRGERGEGRKKPGDGGAPPPPGAEGPAFTPISHLPSPLYKTGDLCRWLDDGNIEFLGRIDHQVKIRGFRIELGEIENQLAGHHLVKEAVTIVRTTGGGDPYLCAYLVLAAEEEAPLGRPCIDEWREHLAQALPEYMIPAHFVEMKAIPLTPNGKVDRGGLPAPEAVSARHTIEPPENETEEKLLKIWADVLECDPEGLSVTDNFFQAGGHSLKGTVLASRIHRRFQVKMPLVQLFKTPRIRDMAQYIRRAEQVRFFTIPRAPLKPFYPLSTAQKQLFVIQQMDPDSTVYNLPLAIPLEPDIDIERLEAVFRQLVQRHESFRTSFHIEDGEPRQKIHTHARLALSLIELEPPDETGDGGRPAPFDPLAYVLPFDLAQPPLLRVSLFKHPEGNYTLLVDMPHIISDGVSLNILRQEFQTLYQGRVPAEPRLQYKDFAWWQQEKKVRDMVRRQERFWLDKYSGEIPQLDLPLDYPRPPVQSFSGGTIPFRLEPEAVAGLKRLGEEHEITLFMVLLAVTSGLMNKLSGREDLVVGIPVAGRRHTDLESVIGMFVNTLPIRLKPRGLHTFRDFLADLKTVTLEAFDNQDYPFEEMVRHLLPQRDAARNPLFDVMFNFQAFGGGGDAPGPAAPPTDPPGGDSDGSGAPGGRIAKFDLNLLGIEAGEQLFFSLEYCRDLFMTQTIHRFIRYFKILAAAVMDNPYKLISDIDIIPFEEKEEILVRLNRTAKDYPGEKLVHRLFEKQVTRSAEKVAVIEQPSLDTLRTPASDGKARVHLRTALDPLRPAIRYHALNRAANRLAHRLLETGVEPGAIVGIMAERSLEMIVAVLAVLKAGAAFLPISPSLPFGRQRLMAKDSGLRVLLTQSHLRRGNSELLDSLPGNIFYLDHEGTYTADRTDPRTAVTPNHPGYVIYTSGTTGTPKGVVLEHQGIVNYLRWAAATYVKHDTLSFPLYTDLSFDLTVTSLFVPLVTGNTITVYPGEGKEPLVERIIRENKVGVLKLTPAHLQLVKAFFTGDERVPVRASTPGGPGFSLRRLVLGGENLEASLARDIHQLFEGRVEIYNEYGPTETVVGSMIYRYDPDTPSGASVPIGLPIGNTRIYLMTAYGRPVPPGVAGELYIGGAGVGRGYLNRPELTAQRFVGLDNRGDDHGLPRQPLYKTGDLARYLPAGHPAHGNLEFLGRIDQQVKIRGFRIELGEIENHLKQFKKPRPIASLLEEKPLTPEYLTGVKRCTRCLLSERHAGIRFDEEGVCNTCRDYERYEPHVKNYFKTPGELEPILEEAKKNRGESQYDCLLLFSGGKDSTYTLYRLIDMGLKVLTYTFDNGYISDAAFENISRTTSALKVDHIVGKAQHMNRVFIESLQSHHNVCHGCWNALNTYGAKLAREKGISLVISGLSRGQIFDMRLHGLFQAGVFKETELREQLLLFRKTFHSVENKFSRIMGESLEASVVESTHFLDFFRYDNTPVDQLNHYLDGKGWIKPADTGFCSSNCTINDVGIYMFTRETGTHFYEEPLSWDVRMGIMPREDGLKEIAYLSDVNHVDGVLREIGYYGDNVVEDAVVVDWTGPRGDKHLCAYYVAPTEIPVSQLRDFLGAQLPEYMVPTYFVPLDHIPLAAGGKVNRKALPQPGVTSTENFQAPENETEEQLVALCAGLLQMKPEELSTGANLFQVGATSLEMVRIAAELNREYSMEIPIMQVFAAPTVKALAQLVGSGRTVGGRETAPYVSFNESGDPTIFCLPPAVAYGLCYKELAELLGGYGFCAFNFIQAENRMEQYLEIMDNRQPMGACILLGYSDGGMAALDLAARVEKAGRRVSDIILLDAFRGTKKIEGEVLREFIQGLEQGMEEMGVSYLRDLVVQNIGAYQEYLSGLGNLSPVDAVLHLIVSEGEDIQQGLAHIPKDRGWSTLTGKICIPYHGAGRHDQMLAEPHLKTNASIISKILSKCKKY